MNRPFSSVSLGNSPRLSRRDARHYRYEFSEALHGALYAAFVRYTLLTGDLAAIAITRPRVTVRKALQRMYKQKELEGRIVDRQIVYYLPGTKWPVNPGPRHELLSIGVDVVFTTSLKAVPWVHDLPGIQPDRAYEIVYQDKTGRLILESDDSTEGKAQWQAKILAYHAHRERAFRVLTVAKAPHRTQQLIGWTAEVVPTRQFFFATAPSYATHPFGLLTRVWQTPKGEYVSFLEG